MTSYRRNHQKRGFFYSGLCVRGLQPVLTHISICMCGHGSPQDGRAEDLAVRVQHSCSQGKGKEDSPAPAPGERLCVLGGRTHNFSC